jgi:pyridoxal phosphate enzyme (YggS family)
MSVQEVASRLESVRGLVSRLGRDPERLRIVAVTKGFGVDAVRAAVGAGLSDVGENYARELEAKAAGLSPVGVVGDSVVRWHFLGPVQRNKVSHLAPLVSTWHALDRFAAAAAVARAAPGAEVMVQVNYTGAPGRPGCPPAQVAELVARCRELPLDVSGLMTVGPQGDPEGTRQCFRWVAAKARELDLREVSMGMSDDFELAVAEGATTLRLGRVIFGPRLKPLVQRDRLDSLGGT